MAARAALASFRDVLDGVVSEAEPSKLRANGHAEIDVDFLVVLSSMDPAADDVRIRGRGDPISDLRADLEATRPNARTDGCDESRARSRVRSGDEVPNANAHDARRYAAPSRVDGENPTARRIGDEHRHAIGNAYGGGVPCSGLGDDGVRLEGERRPWVSAGHLSSTLGS